MRKIFVILPMIVFLGILFLILPSIFGQPRCMDSCITWNNWDFIYGNIFEKQITDCHESGFIWNATSGTCGVHPTPFRSIS